MTYHSYLEWDSGIEQTEEMVAKVVAEVITGLKSNKEYMHDECYTPDAYMVMSLVDSCIYNIGKLLDKHGSAEGLTAEVLTKLLEPAPEAIKIVVEKVMKEFDAWPIN